jgi:hypothetical protein
MSWPCSRGLGGAGIINLLTAQIAVSWSVCHSLIFPVKAGAYPSGPPYSTLIALPALHSKARLLRLPSSIRLGWMWLTVTNALAYFYNSVRKKIYYTDSWNPRKSIIVSFQSLFVKINFQHFKLICICQQTKATSLEFWRKKKFRKKKLNVILGLKSLMVPWQSA